MKKLLKVFLVLFLTIGIIGCGGKNNLTAKEVYELLINDFSYEDIASILNKDVKSIYNTVQRLRQKIRSILK